MLFRSRFPTDRVDTIKNRDELRDFMKKVGQKIRNRTFCFAATFYWLDEKTKAYFSELEGREVKPEPEHVTFGEYAQAWMERKIPKFASVTKQRDYRQAITNRILPFFQDMPFSQITATVVETFIDNQTRTVRAKDPSKAVSPRNGTPLSPKTFKNAIGPMKKIWVAACNDYNWNLRDPFSGVTDKLKELSDQALQGQEEQLILNEELGEKSRREIFLLAEWQQLLAQVDPHYHLVMDLLLMGMIGSELEGLLKSSVADDVMKVRSVVVRDQEGQRHLKFKPKTWYRAREIPLTMRLRSLLNAAMATSTNPSVISFAKGISLPANRFVLTMKDGSPFNYASFRKTVWNKAMKKSGMEMKVPYASRHTFVEWSLVIGVTKERLVDLMGHANKQMIDSVYGNYRKGLVEERPRILDFLGEDFLLLEEMKSYFLDRYQRIAGEGNTAGNFRSCRS